MTPFLDVPFLAEEAYIDFLYSNRNYLESIHFSLIGEKKMDNGLHSSGSYDTKTVIELLGRLSGPRKYALLNSRFYGPSLLQSGKELRQLIQQLEQYLEAGVMNGIVYCDHYLLQCLSNEAPDVMAMLEAVPGINTMLDSRAKIEAHLAYIGATHFQIPKKLILDRSLNRNLSKLAKTAHWCREGFPEIKLALLANEGCLPFCPYRSAHDAYLALDHIHGKDCNQEINRTLGCVQLLKKQPYRILQSPFIRPEDIDAYLYDVDVILISGRVVGADFLQRTIRTYIDRSHKGNLLELLDSPQWLAEELYIDNTALSFDFANMLSVCNNRCDTCRFCMELFQSISHPLVPAGQLANI